MGFLSNLISPLIAVNMIRKSLESQLKRPVSYFTIIYYQNLDKLNFNVDGIYYAFESDAIKKVLKTQVKSNLKKGQELDYLILEIKEDNSILAKIYYSENGEKKYNIIKL